LALVRASWARAWPSELDAPSPTAHAISRAAHLRMACLPSCLLTVTDAVRIPDTLVMPMSSTVGTARAPALHRGCGTIDSGVSPRITPSPRGLPFGGALEGRSGSFRARFRRFRSLEGLRVFLFFIRFFYLHRPSRT